MPRNKEKLLNLETIKKVHTLISTGHPDRRKRQAQEYYELVENGVVILRRRREGRRAEWQNRAGSHTGEVPTSLPVHSLNSQKHADFYKNQALCLTPIEMVIGALLSDWLPDYKGWEYVIGAGTGLVVMLGIRPAAKNKFNFELPTLSEEEQKKVANVLTGLFVLAAAILLVLRFSSSGRDLFSAVALAVIGLVLPGLAAIYFQLSDHYRELNDLAEDFDALDHVIGAAEGLLLEMDLVLAGGTVTETESEEESVPATIPVEAR